MNSINDLNIFSSTPVTYEDLRNPKVKFVSFAVTNFNAISPATEFAAQYGADIDDIIRPDIANCYYKIDVSGVSGATVTWNNIPAGLSVVNPSSGVYIIRYIQTAEQWAAVRSPTITVPTNFQGSFFYESSIYWNEIDGLKNVSWSAGIFVPLSIISSFTTLSSTPKRARGITETLATTSSITATLSIAGLSGATQTDWLASQVNNITGAPTVVAPDPSGIWTYTVSPSNPATVSFITYTASVQGLQTSWNPTTKTATFIGTKSQINAAVASLTFTATSTKADFSFNYTGVSSLAPSTVYTRIQTARCLNLQRLTDARGIATYATGIDSLVGTSSPLISDPDYTGNGVYTLKIKPTQPSLIDTISSTGLTAWGPEQQYTDAQPDVFQSGSYGSNFNVMALGLPESDAVVTNGGGINWFAKSGTTWTRIKTTYSNVVNQRLGHKVIMADDDTLIASAYGYYTIDPNDPIGRVYVYQRTTGNEWSLVQTLTPPNEPQDAWFGWQISASRNGDVLAVAEPTDTDTGETRLGRVHIYRRTGTGNYSLSQTINDPETDLATDFGRSQCKLNADGTLLVVTDLFGPTDDTYFYSYNGTTWNLDTSLSNTRRQIEWIPTSPYRYVYTNGTTIYVMSKSGSSYTQTTAQTLSASIFDVKFGYNATRAIGRIGGIASTNRTFLLLDFNNSTNAWTENRTIDMSSYFQNIIDYMINDSGSEMVFIGRLADGTNGFVTYTFGPKPNAFNNSTKEFTIQGLKAEVNADIDTVKIKTNAGVISTITFDVSVVTPESNTQTKQFKATLTS